jgi:hypothetical protein
VASLAIGVVWLLSGGGWPTRAAWPGILGSGPLWFGLYMVTLNWGERDVDAGPAAMLVNIGPILLALLGGCWLLHERFPRWLVAGMAVSFGGVPVVGISESNRGRTSVSAWFCAWLRPPVTRPGWCAAAGPAPCLGRPGRHVRLLHWHSHESLNARAGASSVAMSPWRCGTADLMTGIGRLEQFTPAGLELRQA